MLLCTFFTVVKHIFITIEICKADSQAFRFVTQRMVDYVTRYIVDDSDKFPLSETRHFLICSVLKSLVCAR